MPLLISNRLVLIITPAYFLNKYYITVDFFTFIHFFKCTRRHFKFLKRFFTILFIKKTFSRTHGFTSFTFIPECIFYCFFRNKYFSLLINFRASKKYLKTVLIVRKKKNKRMFIINYHMLITYLL